MTEKCKHILLRFALLPMDTPPLSPGLCSHTVECSGLWVLLSSQEDNGCTDAWMQACTHTLTLRAYPFHPVSLHHWGGGHEDPGMEMGRGRPHYGELRRGLGQHVWPEIGTENKLYLILMFEVL